MTPSDDDARVARLLREARHEGTVPDDVAARLDGVLADLARERSAATPPASPTRSDPDARTDVVLLADHAARRRRRRATTLLVAAAAVVAAIGIGIAVPSMQASDDDAATSSDAGGSAADEELSAEGALPEAPSSLEGQAEPGAESAPERENDLEASRDAAALAPRAGEILDGGPRGLRTGTLEDDVRDTLAAVVADPVPAAAPACAATPGSGGVGILTTYDDVPALLVVDPSTGAARVLGCSDGDLLATIGAD